MSENVFETAQGESGAAWRSFFTEALRLAALLDAPSEPQAGMHSYTMRFDGRTSETGGAD